MAGVKYFYIGEEGQKPSKVKGVETKYDVPENPILNFDKNFINGLNSIKPTDLGQSIPYISLSILGDGGVVEENLNINYFHKPVGVNNIATGGRFADRPGMSLKSLELKSSQAGGYLYYINVILGLKIHSPESLEESAVLSSMLIPGIPLLLEYGWNSPDEVLNKKEKVLFQVSTYNLTIDTTGQIDITVRGMALNETLNNAYVGDTEGFVAKVEDLKVKLAHIRELKKKKKKNHALLEKMASESEVEDALKIARGNRNKLRDSFETLWSELEAKEEEVPLDPRYKKRKTKIVRFHDLIKIMLEKTLINMSGLFLGIKNINIVYGGFNKSLTAKDIKNIADFPVDINRFETKLKVFKKNGLPVITIGKFFTVLCSQFLENEDYWDKFLPKKTKEEFSAPEVLVKFSNNGADAILHFLDVRGNVPNTLKDIIKIKKGEKENLIKEFDKEKAVMEENIPIFRIGHANSFIKNISMSHIMDGHMKATLIERMTNKNTVSQRDPSPQSSSREGVAEEVDSPFKLPLRGSATLIGHTEWKPFRYFYLAAGIYVINAIYVITGIQHKLSSEGYETTIDFIHS